MDAIGVVKTNVSGSDVGEISAIGAVGINVVETGVGKRRKGGNLSMQVPS